MAVTQTSLGHEVTVVVLPDTPLANRAGAAGLSLMPVNSPLVFQRDLGRLLCSDDRPDIIHLHSTQDLDLTMVPLAWARAFGPGDVNPRSRSQIADAANIRNISRAVDSPIAASEPRGRTRVVLQTHIWISHSKRDPIHKALYSLVDSLWCSSEAARETLTRFIPIAPEKIRVVRYGRDIEALNHGFLPRTEARRIMRLPSDATVVGCVARIDAGKGVRELLDACLQLMPIEPSLHLMWIGPPTADDPAAVALGATLTAEIAALPEGLRSRIHFPGAVADSYKYLRAFDIFALPTYAECFSLALLEAQLAGLPCLVTSSGGSPSIVTERETGWLFEPRSADACLAALKRALSERPLWPSFGERAHAQVESKYDASIVLPATIDAYRELLDRN